MIQNHPGTIVYNTDRFGGWSSLENAWHQVDEFGKDLLEISQKYPDGIHLLGKKLFKFYDVFIRVNGDHMATECDKCKIKNFLYFQVTHKAV